MLGTSLPLCRVGGIDPGKHIGMSLFVDGSFNRGLEAHGIPELAETLDAWEPTHLVVENFLGGNGHTNHYDPTTIIGAAQMWAHLHDVPVTLQSPGILRVRLKQADGLHPSKHVRCSAAHILHYLKRNRMC